jgi:hypothetical protein
MFPRPVATRGGVVGDAGPCACRTGLLTPSAPPESPRSFMWQPATSARPPQDPHPPLVATWNFHNPSMIQRLFLFYMCHHISNSVEYIMIGVGGHTLSPGFASLTIRLNMNYSPSYQSHLRLSLLHLYRFLFWCSFLCRNLFRGGGNRLEPDQLHRRRHQRCTFITLLLLKARAFDDALTADEV